jgi:branched-chain amino acid transport system substrate-binding protein
MTSAFVGQAVSKGESDPEDLFRVDSIVAGDKTAPAVSETGCTLQWPA